MADAEAPECPVCFTTAQEVPERSLATLRPCGHQVCVVCTARHTRRDIRCPICRQAMCGVTDGAAPVWKDRAHEVVIVCPGPNGHAGVTLTNDANGVRVTRTKKADAMHAAGIRAGDVLRDINGIALCDHTLAVRVVEAATKQCEPLVCTRVRLDTRTRDWRRRVASALSAARGWRGGHVLTTRRITANAVA